MAKPLILCLALAGFAGAAVADEKADGKTTCPKECERRAKAALAIAATKKEPAAPAVAPAPKEKPAAKKALCPCGDDCKCAAGTCPAACPTAKAGCTCVSAPGGVGTCGSYLCPANGGAGGCPCTAKLPAPPVPSVTPALVW